MLVQTMLMTPRQNRGLEIAKTNRLRKTEKGWIVPSQSGKGTYLVGLDGHDYNCSCPDCKFRQKKCKHIWAVEYWTTRSVDMNGKSAVSSGMRVTYSQNWPAYNKAQSREKALFMRLLADLCSGIEQEPYKFGRPKLPLSDMAFCSTFKVFSLYSGRRFSSDMKIAKEYGYITKEPHYNSIFNYLQKPELTPILNDLIIKTSLALKSIETDFAVDSSGFATCRFARWYNFKYGRQENVRIWIKAHIMTGVKTNIVTSVRLSEGKANDSPFLKELVNETANGFEIGEVSCDKAYSSRENHNIIAEVGGTPFIPFKGHTTPRPRNSPLWKKMWHFFMYNNEEFMNHYHKRSNVESTFMMIKSKFGDSVSSKKKTAQFNEVLCKILCHNICVVIQEMHELGFMHNEKCI